MRYYFIVNPNSGGGRGLKRWNRVQAFLDRNGIDYEIFFTTGTGDATQKAKELTKDVEGSVDIITVGGDGTIGFFRPLNKADVEAIYRSAL